MTQAGGTKSLRPVLTSLRRRRVQAWSVQMALLVNHFRHRSIVEQLFLERFGFGHVQLPRNP